MDSFGNDLGNGGFGRTGGSFSYNYFDELEKQSAAATKPSRFRKLKKTRENVTGADEVVMAPEIVPEGWRGELYRARVELKTAGVFVGVAQGVQIAAFLLMTYLFPTHVLILPTLAMSLVAIIIFFIIDKRFDSVTGRRQTAFRIGTGYFWLIVALLFSLIGFLGGIIFSCKGKSNCTSDYTFDMMKAYAVIVVFQGVVLAIVAGVTIVIKQHKAIEARKTTSIHISKPKAPGN